MNLDTALQSARTSLTALAVTAVAAACFGSAPAVGSATAGQHGTDVSQATKEYRSSSAQRTLATKEYKVSAASTKEYRLTTAKTKEYKVGMAKTKEY